jgi:hypothetical protein
VSQKPRARRSRNMQSAVGSVTGSDAGGTHSKHTARHDANGHTRSHTLLAKRHTRPAHGTHPWTCRRR